MSLLYSICCSKHRLRVAVCWDSLTEGTASFLTYSELISNSHKISCYLEKHVIKHLLGLYNEAQAKKTPVCIYGHSCPEVLSALLGVMALPAPYMPMDLALPSSQKESLLCKNNVGVVLVHLSLLQDFLSQVESWSSCCASLDSGLTECGFIVSYISWVEASSIETSEVRIRNTETWNQFTILDVHVYNREIKPQQCRVCNLECMNLAVTSDEEKMQCKEWEFPHIPPTQTAYTLHTSGTSGLPKCVCVPHCCVVPNIVDLQSRFQLDRDDIIFNAAPLTFDPSVVEIFLALSSGAALLVVPEKIKRSPTHLASVLFQRHHTTVLQVTPTLVTRFSEQQIKRCLLGPLSHVRVLAFGGEVCPSVDDIAKWKSPENKTSIFNLYGITETSCWATCYQISQDDLETMSSNDSSSQPAVPLGDPLLGTEVKVQDDAGGRVWKGYGQIWIGGAYRVCLLEEDKGHIPPSCLRPSGDYGYLDESGRLHYRGRCDRQIKRYGHRINLGSIQHTIETLDGVMKCVLATSANSRPSLTTQIPTDASTNSDSSLLAFIVPHHPERVSLESLLSTMRAVLPNYSIPDEMAFVKYLPMTQHGKVDIQALVTRSLPGIILNSPLPSPQDTLLTNYSDITALVKSAATVVLGLENWASDERLIDIGASSFDVVRIANWIDTEIGKSVGDRSEPHVPGLVEYMLTKSLDDVSTYIHRELVSAHSEMDAATSSTDKPKRRVFTGDISGTSSVSKRARVEMVPVRSYRRGQVFSDGIQQTNTFSRKSSFISDHTYSCSIQIKWKVDTGKCVDASPLVVQHTGDCSDSSEGQGSEAVVYIGSHSGWFFSVELLSGRVLWKTLLNDRIESSACTSLCGQFVIVGTYAGSLYTLVASTGAIHWCITLPSPPCEPIKSSPIADPQSGLIWFGSHDQHLYAVNILVKAAVHKVYLGGGSCFSSPCVDSNRRTLYTATLQGKVSAINLDTGEVKWMYVCPKPLFSSPTILPRDGSVVVGCVNGTVYVLASNGHLVGTLPTTQSIFSSCCVASYTVHTPPDHHSVESALTNTDDTNQTELLSTHVYCGSHDKHIYCWNGDTDFELEWKTNLESNIYSTPCCADLQASVRSSPNSALFCTSSLPVLCVCSSIGVVYLLNPLTGATVASFRLPGDIFSSPVLFNNCIVVGCRDDNVYCLDVVMTLST